MQYSAMFQGQYMRYSAKFQGQYMRYGALQQPIGGGSVPSRGSRYVVQYHTTVQCSASGAVQYRTRVQCSARGAVQYRVQNSRQ